MPCRSKGDFLPSLLRSHLHKSLKIAGETIKSAKLSHVGFVRTSSTSAVDVSCTHSVLRDEANFILVGFVEG